MPPLKWQRGGALVSKAGKYKSTKIIASTNDDGEAIAFDLYAGGRHDTKTTDIIVPKIPKGVYVTADRGYDDKRLRWKLRRQGYYPVIPKRQMSKTVRRRTPKPHIYKSRWVIEQGFSRYDQFRKLTVRYERDPWSYKAFWYLGASLLNLHKLTG